MNWRMLASVVDEGLLHGMKQHPSTHQMTVD
jgi:hypothetical protein